MPGGQDPVSELLLGGQDPGTPKTLSQGPISPICNTPNNPKCKLASHQGPDFQTMFFYWCCPMPPLWHQCSNVGWPWPPPGQDPRGSHWIRALWARIQGGDLRGMCTGSKLSTWQGCRSQQPPQNCSDSVKAGMQSKLWNKICDFHSPLLH